MRLGGYFRAEELAELEGLCEPLDTYGLSAIPAPERLLEMSEDECSAFGEEATRLGVVIGEAGMWDNLMVRDDTVRDHRIGIVRDMLVKADAMRCRCVVTLVGSSHVSDNPLAPDPYMITKAARREFRDVTLRIMEGLDLSHTAYVIEPWPNSFFYTPDDVGEFLDSVGHPKVGLHLDLMNMVSQETFFATSRLVESVFTDLRQWIVSAHLKDVQWDYDHSFLKWDEVLIGDGVIDYERYLAELSTLAPDTTCFCEHLSSEEEYADNFRRLHGIAERRGLTFIGRSATLPGVLVD